MLTIKLALVNEELDLRHLPMGSYHFVLNEGTNLGFGFIKN